MHRDVFASSATCEWATPQELETGKQALRQSEERRKADELLMMRIKAKLWDMENSDF